MTMLHTVCIYREISPANYFVATVQNLIVLSYTVLHSGKSMGHYPANLDLIATVTLFVVS